jgi:hypothetical protein
MASVTDVGDITMFRDTCKRGSVGCGILPYSVVRRMPNRVPHSGGRG